MPVKNAPKPIFGLGSEVKFGLSDETWTVRGYRKVDGHWEVAVQSPLGSYRSISCSQLEHYIHVVKMAA